MPKVLQINTSANTGSTGRIAAQIGDLAMQNGWESHIAYGRTARPCRSHLYKIDRKYEYLWHGAMTLLFERHCLSSTCATKRLVKYIEKLKPDIIHLHNIHGYYLDMEVLFAFLAKADIPVVWTLHDCWAYTGHCSYYSNINCQKWQTRCEHCPKWRNYPHTLYFERSRSRYELKRLLFNSVGNLTLVPVSHWLGEEVKKSFLASNNIKVITNGVDIDTFKPVLNTEKVRQKYGLGDKHVLLGVATAWGPHKGWSDYIKLSSMISDDCRIVMVGVTDNQKKGLPSSIVTIPRTESQQELAELYSTADIVLNLSNQESFGLTTAEGFACGTPSIVYNCTASPELVTRETGRIVEAGDLNVLCDAINEILAIGKDRIAKVCRNRAVECYDMNKSYAEYLNLYKQLTSL